MSIKKPTIIILMILVELSLKNLYICFDTALSFIKCHPKSDYKMLNIWLLYQIDDIIQRRISETEAS